MQNFKPKTWGGALIVVIVLITVLTVYFQSRNTLDAHVGTTITTAPTTATTKYVDTTPFTSEMGGFTINVPSDWIHVKKDGHDTFVHQQTGSYAQVQLGDYSPALLSVSETSVATELSAANCKLISFAWQENDIYYVAYQSMMDDTVYTTVECTYFDKVDMWRVIYCVPSTYYESFEDEITYMIDTFSFNASAPIPSSLLLFYDPTVNYQFAIPSEWQATQKENTYYAYDEGTGCSMSLVCAESQALYEGFSKVDYTAFAATSRNNFILKTFTCDRNIIYAEAEFVSNQTIMYLIQYMVASGTHEFALTFEVPAEKYDATASVINDVIGMFFVY